MLYPRHLLEVVKTVDNENGFIIWEMVFFNERMPNIVERKVIYEKFIPQMQQQEETQIIDDVPIIQEPITEEPKDAI